MSREVEHRQSYRVAAPGVACLSWAGRTRRYAVDNLSLGGAALLGAPAPRVGARVDACVQMLGVRPVDARARVVRTACVSPRPAFALTFTRLSSDAEDAIHDLWVTAQETRTTPTVLVVARSRRTAAVLAALLQRLGWSAITASTPRIAVEVLERREGRIHWLIAFERLSVGKGTALLAYVGAEHPGVRRLLICPADPRRPDREAIQRGIAEAAVLQPVQPRDIALVIGRRPERIA